MVPYPCPCPMSMSHVPCPCPMSHVHVPCPMPMPHVPCPCPMSHVHVPCPCSMSHAHVPCPCPMSMSMFHVPCRARAHTTSAGQPRERTCSPVCVEPRPYEYVREAVMSTHMSPAGRAALPLRILLRGRRHLRGHSLRTRLCVPARARVPAAAARRAASVPTQPRRAAAL